jgi:inosine/xanthosine triphosphatase
MKKVIVSSLNPVKLNSVKKGFAEIFPDEEFIFEGRPVKSGVADQPLSDEETLRGALNRAFGAKKLFPEADYWAGIEGGIEKRGSEMEAFAWVVISGKNITGKAKTGSFFLPPKVVELVNEGKELGEADDIVFGRTNSKQEAGAVGILTKNLTNRTEYYSHAVVLALIPFVNGNLYKITPQGAEQ